MTSIEKCQRAGFATIDPRRGGVDTARLVRPGEATRRLAGANTLAGLKHVKFRCSCKNIHVVLKVSHSFLWEVTVGQTGRGEYVATYRRC